MTTVAMETEIGKLGKPIISVSVYLRGRDLDPEIVSEVVGEDPSWCQKMGGLKWRSRTLVAQIGLWVFEVASEERPFDDMLEEVLRRVDHSACRLDQIEGVEDAHLDIFVGWADGPNESREFRLTHAHVNKLNQLGLAVCFSADKPDAL